MSRRRGKIVHLEVRLADIFVRALVTRIDRQRTLVPCEREVELGGLSVGQSEQVVHIGVIGLAQRDARKTLDRVLVRLRASDTIVRLMQRSGVMTKPIARDPICRRGFDA